MPWSRYPLPDNLPTTTRCIQIQIPDDKEYTQLFVGALEWLAFWDAYDRDELKRGREVAALWRAAIDSITDCSTNEPISRADRLGGHTIFVNMEEEMPNYLQAFQSPDGTWCARLDCGCGQYIDFELLVKGGSIGGITGNSVPGGNNGGFPSNTPLLTGGLSDCYRDGAAEIYMSQIADWAVNIIGVISNGIDFFTSADEIIEFGSSLVDLVTAGDNYSSLDGLTAGEVRTALLGESSTIASGFPTGELVRADLFNINELLPNFSGIVPVGYLADRWATFGNVRLLNSRLAIKQAECATGSSGALPPPSIQPGLQETLVVGNVTYRLYNITTDFTFTTGDFPISIDTGFEVQGLGWSGIGRATMTVKDNNNRSISVNVTEGVGTAFGIMSIDGSDIPPVDFSDYAFVAGQETEALQILSDFGFNTTGYEGRSNAFERGLEPGNLLFEMGGGVIAGTIHELYLITREVNNP